MTISSLACLTSEQGTPALYLYTSECVLQLLCNVYPANSTSFDQAVCSLLRQSVVGLLEKVNKCTRVVALIFMLFEVSEKILRVTGY